MSATRSHAVPGGAGRGGERRCHTRRSVIESRLVTVDVGGQKGVPILDLSESGMGVQAFAPVQTGMNVVLQFSLPDLEARIEAVGRVAWVEHSGRTGIRFVSISEACRRVLRDWISAEEGGAARTPDFSTERGLPVAALQREISVRNLTTDAALSLIVDQARSATRADGAAIALSDGAGMVCRATTGRAPDLGVRLNPDSRLSSECIQSRAVVRCDDTERDLRVNPVVGLRLGFRSAILAPIIASEKVAGLLEVFSATPRTFKDADIAVLREFARLVAAVTGGGECAEGPAGRSEVASLRPLAAAILREASTVCDACGHVNPDRARVCEKCDIPLRVPENFAPEASDAGALAREALAAAREPSPDELPPTELGDDDKEKRVGRVLKIAALIALVLALLFGAWRQYARFRQSKALSVAPAQPLSPPPVASTQMAAPEPTQITAPTSPATASKTMPGIVVASIPPAKPEARAPATPERRTPAAAVGTSAPQTSNLPPEPPPTLAPDTAAHGHAAALTAVLSTPVEPQAVPAPPVRSQGVTGGELLYRVNPAYPELANKLGIQGAVVLAGTVNKKGSVQNIRVLRGDEVLARAAIYAVRQWRYRPYQLNGEPIEVETVITINFTKQR